MTRVPFERLEYRQDGDRFLLGGVPFTGVAVHETVGGPFRGEEEYHEGVLHGVARVWWLPTGKLNHEQEWVRGQPHGTSRSWFPHGSLRSEELYEGGVCARRRTWDERGTLVADVEGVRDESGVLVQDVDGQDPARDISDWFNDAEDGEPGR